MCFEERDNYPKFFTWSNTIITSTPNLRNSVPIISRLPTFMITVLRYNWRPYNDVKYKSDGYIWDALYLLAEI